MSTSEWRLRRGNNYNISCVYLQLYQSVSFQSLVSAELSLADLLQVPGASTRANIRPRVRPDGARCLGPGHPQTVFGLEEEVHG